MQPWRQELRELIRSVETVLSLEAFGAPLSAEEPGVILLCAEDLAKKFSTPGTRQPDGHDTHNQPEGKTRADF